MSSLKAVITQVITAFFLCVLANFNQSLICFCFVWHVSCYDKLVVIYIDLVKNCSLLDINVLSC